MYTDTVKKLPGYSVQNSPSRSFLLWGGAVGSGGIVYDIVRMGCPRRTHWKCCVHLCASVLYRRLSPPFQFSLSAVTLVYLSQWGSQSAACVIELWAHTPCVHQPVICSHAANTCSMTSGAIQQGVPTKVCRDLARERSPPAASHADTPKSAIWIWPSVPRRMLPAYNRATGKKEWQMMGSLPPQHWGIGNVWEQQHINQSFATVLAYLFVPQFGWLV